MVIKPGSAPTRAFNSLQRAALRILRRFGTDAHVYTAGANGAMVNLLQTGNYILSDGSTGYSAVDGPVGLVLDGAGSVGSELLADLTFDTPAAWSTAANWAVTGGKLVATAAAVASNTSTAIGVITAGKTYKLSITCESLSAGGFKCLQEGGGSYFGDKTAAGTYEGILTATNTGKVYVWCNVLLTASFDNITLKEVTGIHATQATTASKPTERRGLLNLLTYSQDFTNGAWTKTNVTVSGNKLLETTATGVHNIAETQVTVSGTPYTIAVECSAAERNYIGVYAGTPGQGAIFNLTTGAYFGNLVGAPTSYSIAPTGTGTYLCVINYTATGAASAPSVYVCDGTGAFSYTGVATNGINVAKVGHFTGTLTSQQIIDSGGIPLTTSAAASNATAGRYSWSFDGTDDTLTIPSAAFGMADDHATIVACRYDRALGQFPCAANPACNSGTATRVGAISLSNTGEIRSYYTNDAAATVQTLAGTVTVGEHFVAATRNLGGLVKSRKNGGTWSSPIAPTGVFTLNQGKISGGVSTDPWQGPISIVIAIKGTLSDADMLTLERFAASTLPNAPSF